MIDGRLQLPFLIVRKLLNEIKKALYFPSLSDRL